MSLYLPSCLYFTFDVVRALVWTKISSNSTKFGILKQVWLFWTHFVLGEWSNWLPTVGHKLAMTNMFRTQNILHENKMVWFLCVHVPLPDPWLSWAFVWTSCMHQDPIGSCSYLFPGQWFSCEHRWIPWLFLFSFSLTSLILLQEEQVQCCHHVLVYK